jgi:DME family drug/metabolite transporter
VTSSLANDDRLATSAGRLFLGAATLLALGGGRRVFAGWHRSDRRALAVGTLGLAGFQLAYPEAVALGGVATTTAISIGLAPVMTGIRAAVAAKRGPSPVWLVGSATALVGLVLLAFGLGSAGPTGNLLGVVLSAVAACCFSLQAIGIEQLSKRRSEASATAAIFSAAAVVLLPVTLFEATQHSLLTVHYLTVVSYLGVVTGGLAYWLFARGIRSLGAAAAVTISLLEPVAAAVIAVALLGEHLSGAQFVGIGLICVAIILIGVGSVVRHVPENPQEIQLKAEIAA